MYFYIRLFLKSHCFFHKLALKVLNTDAANQKFMLSIQPMIQENLSLHLFCLLVNKL